MAQRFAFSATSSAVRTPSGTDTTAGWRSGNCTATSGSWTPYRSARSAMAFTRASSPGGTGPWSYVSPGEVAGG